jgi:predicted neuraminidase
VCIEGPSLVLLSLDSVDRHHVIDPYRVAFDPKVDGTNMADLEPPGHRYLFHCYTYQHHLIQVASIAIEMARYYTLLIVTEYS